MSRRMTEQPKPHDDYYLGLILKIAASASVELGEATLAVYLERLRHLSAEQIQTATARTIEEWAKPAMMPPLTFILERCSAYQEIHEPMPTFKQIEDRSGVSHAEVMQWLEDGKAAQNAHIAALEADPKWRQMRDRLVKRDFVKPTEVPQDAEERKTWARAKAQDGGWL